ncbi:hypothetical protein [Nocardioides nitrophenolicus]|uniref:hypothetical protein n=1 Tax=Nocardioides nitrophenolicus TaxID=60489 RepID=UPI001956EA38|nr:hypothetical protein [Nocardioides nitrophenolicus]MBM7519717.1 hypothetical protein [Nocardioides nitrophenolicus]
MRAPSQPPFPIGVLFVLPTILFWFLVVKGATSGDEGAAGRYAGHAFGVAGLTLAVFAFVKIRQVRARNAERLRAVRDGIRATARIVSTRVTGHLNQDPYVVFELEIAPEAGASYRTSVTELVSQLAIPRIQPGMVLDVHVHPDDERHVVIDAAALGR